MFENPKNQKCTNDEIRGAFGLPESESGFEIMILIHGFILANGKHDFESGEPSKSYSVQVSKRIKYIP